GVFVWLQKAGDQAELALRPGSIAREYEPAVVFDQSGHDRRRVVPECVIAGRTAQAVVCLDPAMHQRAGADGAIPPCVVDAHGAAVTPCRASRSMVALSRPSTSPSTACVCSPSSGGGWRYSTGVADSRSGLATCGVLPASGCAILCCRPRA